jgi:hypothetical protein
MNTSQNNYMFVRSEALNSNDKHFNSVPIPFERRETGLYGEQARPIHVQYQHLERVRRGERVDASLRAW